MEKNKTMTINETPLRTVRHFHINNIEIKEDIIKEAKVFNEENVSIELPEGIMLDKSNQIYDLKFGMGEVLTNQALQNNNQTYTITIPKDTKIEDNLIITFRLDEENPVLIDNIYIKVEENASANIIFKYTGENVYTNTYYHNGISKVIVEPHASLNVVYANVLPKQTNNFFSIESITGEEAELTYNIIDFGGQLSVSNYYANLTRKTRKNKSKYHLSRRQR